MSFKYRKKPAVIEAFQNNGSGELDRSTAPQWFVDAVDDKLIRVPSGAAPKGTLVIETNEGVMRADVGDWIIRGVKGELYPCKPDVFEATYEKVDED